VRGGGKTQVIISSELVVLGVLSLKRGTRVPRYQREKGEGGLTKEFTGLGDLQGGETQIALIKLQNRKRNQIIKRRSRSVHQGTGKP